MKKNCKNLILIVLSIVCILFFLNIFYVDSMADSYANNLKYTISFNKAYITGYLGKPTVVNIPSTISGYPVVGISKEAFGGCVMTEVVIPESVVSIGDYAFVGCTNLKQVSIPDSVKSTGNLFQSNSLICLRLSTL